MMRSFTATALAFVVVALPVAPSGAQDVPDLAVALDPPTTKSPSRLGVVANGSGSGISGRLPRSVVLGVQRGFKLETAAVSDLCKADQAAASTCPEASRVGKGTAAVTANTVFGPFDVTAQIDVFLAAPTVAGDLAGIVVTVSAAGERRSSSGRITPLASGPVGYEVRFDGLDQAVQSQPGVTVSLKRLEVVLGASRVEKRRVVVRKRVRYRDKRGRRRTKVVRRRVVRRIRHAFITNPARCASAWTSHGTITFADGSVLERDLSVACRAA